MLIFTQKGPVLQGILASDSSILILNQFFPHIGNSFVRVLLYNLLFSPFTQDFEQNNLITGTNLRRDDFKKYSPKISFFSRGFDLFLTIFFNIQ